MFIIIAFWFGMDRPSGTPGNYTGRWRARI